MNENLHEQATRAVAAHVSESIADLERVAGAVLDVVRQAILDLPDVGVFDPVDQVRMGTLPAKDTARLLDLLGEGEAV